MKKNLNIAPRGHDIIHGKLIVKRHQMLGPHDQVKVILDHCHLIICSFHFSLQGKFSGRM